MTLREGYTLRARRGRAHAVSGAQGTVQRALCGMEVVVTDFPFVVSTDDPHNCRRCWLKAKDL